MSEYVSISKEIGFNGAECIPSINRAKELVNSVVMRGDIKAYKEIFKIIRFAPSPTNDDEKEALDIIIIGFTEGRKIFS